MVSFDVLKSLFEAISFRLNLGNSRLMLLLQFAYPFRQLRFELCPAALFGFLFFRSEESNRFLGAKLRYSGEIFHAEPLKNFRALQISLTETKWTFNIFRKRRGCGHITALQRRIVSATLNVSHYCASSGEG